MTTEQVGKIIAGVLIAALLLLVIFGVIAVGKLVLG